MGHIRYLHVHYFTNEVFRTKICTAQVIRAFFLYMVNDMKTLIPLFVVAVLSGCASTGQVASNDPVRARVLAELEQAKADGTHPLTEAQYLYPNWVTPHQAP
jgi:hypothetical protein